MNIKKIEQEFEKYVNSYQEEIGDSKYYYLKHLHSYKVANIAKEILEMMNLNQESIDLGYVIGLLHDIGRFKQLEKCETFVDTKQFDHGDEGYKVLTTEEFLKKAEIDEKYHNIISKAVKNHNKFKIEEGLTGTESFYAKLIRDADKIDIYRVIVDNYDCEFNGEVSKEVQTTFYHEKPIDYSIKKNKNDAVLLRFSFLYDINYSESFKLLKKLGYFEKYLNKFKVNAKYLTLFNEFKSKITKYFDDKVYND